MNINKKIHYYGWDRIAKQINDVFLSRIIIIDYVDTYFLSNTEIIDNNWGGIIHHTSSNFSNNNIINLFKNKIFIKSLKYCKFLITLSKYNKNNILEQLKKLNLTINVYVLKHPSPPIFDKIFNINKFEESLNIYNIGAYMRNPYSIYHSNFYYDGVLLNKHKLKGYLMDSYFPEKNLIFNDIVNDINNYNSLDLNQENFNDDSDDIYEELQLELINCTNEIDKDKLTKQLYDIEIKINNNYKLQNYSRSSTNFNYYNYYAYKYIKQFEYKSKTQLTKLLINNNKTVTIHNYLENNDYLKVLTNNIIFCDYIDCSASNTIVECIATCTPIILNRLPAIVEYLGDDYPLYFDKIYNSETDTYHLTKEDLVSTYNYFINMHKSLNINIFIEKLKGIVNSSIAKNKNRLHYYHFKR